MTHTAPTRAEIRLARATVCPSGLLRLPIVPGRHTPVVGYVFAVGSVTVDGATHNADELDVVLAAALTARIDPATILESYVQYVIARKIAAPARLSGDAIAAYLAERVR